MNFKLKIWRQADAKAKGGFETYEVNDISEDTSFLEMLNILNNCISTARRTVRIPK